MAYIHITNQEEAISAIQQQLRDISVWTGGTIPLVAVDGCYDEATRRAVNVFQERYGLPVTGKVDYTTWLTINEIYKALYEVNRVPYPIYPFPTDVSFILRPGDRNNLVYIIQVMLNEIRNMIDLPPVPINGVYDGATVEAVKKLQKIVGIDQTGNMDKITWNMLATDYAAQREKDA